MALLRDWAARLLAVVAAATAVGCIADGKGQVGKATAQDYFPNCGNGAMDQGEQCDDGNRISGDGCEADCTFTCSAGSDGTSPACSDGNPCNGAELCTDKHVCAAATKAPANGTPCGDYSVCQDGACLAKSSKCGDGVVQPPEECDSGKTTGDQYCDPTCHWNCIQNNPLRPCLTPQCKDPTKTVCNADHSCTYTAGTDYQTCTTNGGVTCINGSCTPCGNGIKDTGEECDNGSSNGPGTGCELNCKFSCRSTDPSRDCSVSATANGGCLLPRTGGCNDTTHTCPALVFQPNGTQCGGSSAATYCVAGNCAQPVCGDGIKGPFEVCDDGNLNDRDGCRSNCKLTCTQATGASDCASGNPPILTQPNCNKDYCTPLGLCSYQKYSIGSPCSSSNQNGVCVQVAGTNVGACTLGTCPNGTRELGEECDLGSSQNGQPGSGCEVTCQFSCHNDSDCSDGDPCNGTETCQVVTGGKTCVPGTNVIPDGGSCGTGRVCLMNLTGGCATPFCGDGFVEAPETCDPPNTTGCSATCQRLVNCNLGDQWWAQETAMPASWGQNNTWAASFAGSIRQLMLVHAVQRAGVQPATFDLQLRVCGMQIPDFTLPDAIYDLLSNKGATPNTMEVYGVAFPNALWDNWTPNSKYAFSTTLTAYSLAPGGFVSIGATSLPTGGWNDTGITGADWPVNYADMLPSGTNNSIPPLGPWYQVDMDQDQKWGITAMVKTGPIDKNSPVFSAKDPNPANAYILNAIKSVTNYSYTITDTSNFNGTNVSAVGRSDRFYLAIRALTNATAPYTTRLDSCDQISGTMSIRSADNHVLGCYVSTGTSALITVPGDCAPAVTGLMDQLTPHYSMGNATFTAKRILTPPSSLFATGACAAARQQYPADFPP